jgi:type II secretory pathway pseudopilin PulG
MRTLMRARERGYTLIEAIVVAFLLALAMLGILAVFDASSRINKSESQVADAQGGVRQGLYEMTRAIRMAGSGGLYVTQAILNAPDPNLAGVTVTGGTGYDNVTGGTVTNLAGTAIPIRPGTDLVEVRGVLFSPLVGFDYATGCPCGTSNNCSCIWSAASLNSAAIVGDPIFGQHVNNAAGQRPQFSEIDTYTASASGARPFLVLVSVSDEVFGASTPGAPAQLYSQLFYNVGAITAPTNLAVGNTFGAVDFTNGVAQEFNTEFPSSTGTPAVAYTSLVRRAGILDDVLYFIDNTDPNHPILSKGTRYGNAFDVVPLADDVEDMQIAYGVDTNNTETIGRFSAPSPTDPETTVSNQPGQDKWVPNVPGADNPITSTAAPFAATNFVFNSAGPIATHFPRLHAVMVSVLARSKDPDPTYKAPLSAGLVLMNGPGPTAGGPQYRRRVQTVKINLRNYSFGG